MSSLMLMPGMAGAQAVHGYAGAGAVVAIQGSHRQGSSPSLPTTGAEGTALGAVMEAGALLTPRVALGVEVSLPSRFTSLQETDYLRVFQQESRHRDVTISGVVRVIAASARRIRVGIVGGGGFVQEDTRQRRRDQAGLLPVFPPVFGAYSPEARFSRWSVAALAGADLEIAVSSGIALVPHVRVHIIRRSSNPSEPGWALGLNATAFRPGIGLRAAF